MPRVSVKETPKDCCQVSAISMKLGMVLHTRFQIKSVVPESTTGSYEVANICEDKTNVFTSVPVKHYARCDMTSDGGKWMVIQRRINGSVDFYLNWTDYVYGFGDLDGEFWYGLENIYCLTTREDVELRIELGNGTVPSIVWTYQLFKVGRADTNYRLTIGQGTGVGGTFDAMAAQNGAPFSTRDSDHDTYSDNCAKVYGGAWWYTACFSSNLNGKYVVHTPESNIGVTPGANRLSWSDGSAYQHYTKVQMKIRPKRCSSSAD